MKKLLYLICCMVCIQFASAENKVNDCSETRTEVIGSTAVAAGDVSIGVPPQTITQAYVSLRNTSTKKLYTISAHAYTQTTLYTTLPTGTYTVEAMSMSNCTVPNFTFYSTQTSMYAVGATINITAGGTIIFGCSRN